MDERTVKSLKWNLIVECLDPIVIQGDSRTELLLKQLNKIYEILQNTVGRSRTAQLGLIKISKKIEKEDLDGEMVEIKELI